MSELRIRLAERPAEFPVVYKIRYRVFQVEQGIDPSLEFDDQEDASEHVLAYLDGKPVGTARFRLLDAQTAKVERMAVLSEARGLGIGRKLMEKVLELLAVAQVSVVLLHAQVPVKGFYEKMGFMPEGEEFEEAGISHVKMRKLLK